MAISKIILDGEVQMDVTQDTVTPNSLLAGYTATAANGEQIEGNIAAKSSSDISVDGPTVTIPDGYYDSVQTATIASGSVGTPIATKSAVSNNSVNVTPSVSISAGYIQNGTTAGSPVTVTASELVSGSQTISLNNTYDVTNLEEVVVNVPPNNQNKTVSPTLSQQVISADSGYTGLGNVTVNAMPSGTAGTPIATKGSVSNNSVQVTPSVTNTSGYISGSTVTGSPVTVNASELVSGSRTLTYNQTVDVTNLAEVVVAVDGGGVPINNQSKTVNPSLSQQTVTYDEGYTGLNSVIVTAMPEGSEGTPVADVTTDQSTQNIVVTPKATNTAGYISGGLRVGEPVVINPGVTSFNGQEGAVTYTAPVSSVNGQTGSVTVTIPTKTSDLTNDSGYITAPPNYVVDEGTASGWTYRKWSNNIYECWKNISFSANVDGVWGDNYYKTVQAQSYPVTFASAPWEQATIVSGTKTLFLANNGDAGQTATTTASYLVLRPTNAQVTISFTIAYYAKGTVTS